MIKGSSLFSVVTVTLPRSKISSQAIQYNQMIAGYLRHVTTRGATRSTLRK